MAIAPWPEAVINTNTRFVPMVFGFAWYDPTGFGLSTSDRVTINETCKLASFGATYIYIFNGSQLKIYNLTGAFLSSYSADIFALYPEMAFTRDGRILQYNGSSIVQRGTYQGTPVANGLTIYRGKLQRYSPLADGRYSLVGRYDAVEPIGQIVRSGFDTVNSKFVVVSDYRTIVWSYDGSYDFTLVGSYNHDKAVGFSEGSVVIGGEGEPGKISDIFDYTGDLAFPPEIIGGQPSQFPPFAAYPFGTVYTTAIVRITNAPTSGYCQNVGAEANGTWYCTYNPETGKFTSPSVAAANGRLDISVYVNYTGGPISSGLLVEVGYPVVPSPCLGSSWSKGLSGASTGYVGVIPTNVASFVQGGLYGDMEIIGWA